MKNSKSGRLSGRILKKKVEAILAAGDLKKAQEELNLLPAGRVVGPLFSFLNHKEARIRWAAVSAFGWVTARIAREDMEAARIIMRRLMWNLNDESGGIGWGCPEAMGEILASHPGLRKDYLHILISYTREDANFLEHEMLQRGLLWGIGRLAEVEPDLLKDAADLFIKYLGSTDATVRGLAARNMGLLKHREACPMLESMKGERSPVELYHQGRLTITDVRSLAEQASELIPCG